MVDSNATLRLHRAFDSFGNIESETHYDADGVAVTEGQTGYIDEAFAYTGRLLDSATGLQNNLHRWYDASIGRWMSEDPIGFRAGDANLYRYVGNGPVNGTDPRGLQDVGYIIPPDWPTGYDPSCPTTGPMIDPPPPLLPPFDTGSGGGGSGWKDPREIIDITKPLPPSLFPPGSTIQCRVKLDADIDFDIDDPFNTTIRPEAETIIIITY